MKSDCSGQDLTLRCLIHDLDNVFQTLLDAGDVLASDEKWKSLAAAIHRSAERGQRLVHGITEVSNATFHLATIAEIAVQSARDFVGATRKTARIEFSLDVDHKVRLRGNPVDWERVLMNLLINSAQAIPRQGNVELTARCENRCLTIRVVDDGPGIAPEILPHMFEPNVSTKRANSGLGLHIVRSIVESNGGTVSASNGHDGGAEFVITLPAA